MSVIVKGMEMPKNCFYCAMSSFGVCNIAARIGDISTRPDWCPLVELPEKHGRLIDGDELAAGCGNPYWCRWLSEIEDMPTIVEAEGDDG